jgi:lysophospholipase L1-like esterase
MREEIREHRFEQASVVPPGGGISGGSDLARRKTSPFTLTLPTVFVDSEEKQRMKKRSSSPCRRYCTRFACVAAFLFLIDFLEDMLLTPTSWRSDEVSPARIKRDYSTVHGLDELTSEFVQPWCFKGRSSCDCKDPMVPQGRLEIKKWEHVQKLNAERAKSKNDIDLLFLGDSITEGWVGTSYGEKSPRTNGVPQVFESLFSTGHGGKYEGLALGISGDTSQNLLWRIQNGELPDNLQAPVIWLLIGTNDFGRTWCSSELVVIGIIRVVEELLRLRPGSTIVINSLLPRSFHKKGYVTKGRKGRWWRSSRPALPPLWDDIESVNDELESYAANRRHVVYINTVTLFFMDPTVPEDHLRIDKSLMPDFLHPSEKGYKLWGEKVVEKLEHLVPKR